MDLLLSFQHVVRYWFPGIFSIFPNKLTTESTLAKQPNTRFPCNYKGKWTSIGNQFVKIKISFTFLFHFFPLFFLEREAQWQLLVPCPFYFLSRQQGDKEEEKVISEFVTVDSLPFFSIGLLLDREGGRRLSQLLCCSFVFFFTVVLFLPSSAKELLPFSIRL